MPRYSCGAAFWHPSQRGRGVRFSCAILEQDLGALLAAPLGIAREDPPTLLDTPLIVLGPLVRQPQADQSADEPAGSAARQRGGKNAARDERADAGNDEGAGRRENRAERPADDAACDSAGCGGDAFAGARLACFLRVAHHDTHPLAVEPPAPQASQTI